MGKYKPLPSNYPCANCSGTGVSRICPTAVCSRCGGSGIDPAAGR
jgi:hypothetical protein